MSPTLLLLFLIPAISGMGMELRRRRSVSPFTGSGSATPDGMLIPLELWHCGSDNYTRRFSYETYEPLCPSLTAALNHCCAIHDDCYGQQLGQEKCDSDFCECNRMVTRIPTEEGFKCRGSTNDSCTLLNLFGMFAYGGSSYTDLGSGNVLVSPKSLPEAEGDYMHLYSTCPHVNITLASCAVNFDLCASVHSADFCANDLCHCIMDAAESDKTHKTKCEAAVAHTCRAVFKQSSVVLSRFVTRKNFLNSCFIILGLLFVASASFGFGLYYMHIRANGYRKKAEEGKYLQIHTVESSRSVNPLLSD